MLECLVFNLIECLLRESAPANCDYVDNETLNLVTIKEVPNQIYNLLSGLAIAIRPAQSFPRSSI